MDCLVDKQTRCAYSQPTQGSCADPIYFQKKFLDVVEGSVGNLEGGGFRPHPVPTPIATTPNAEP
jgi:hypothetical protein